MERELGERIDARMKTWAAFPKVDVTSPGWAVFVVRTTGGPVAVHAVTCRGFLPLNAGIVEPDEVRPGRRSR